MDKEISKNPSLSTEDLFKRTRTSADKEFERGVIDAIRKANRKTLIFLDKNHPPNAIAKSISIINRAGKNVKIYALFPKIFSEPLLDLPFSANLILTCISRV